MAAAIASVWFISLGVAVSPARGDCLDDAATWHNVPPVLARAIAMQESGMHPGTISARNANGSYDIGLMQINSSWLPTLARYGIGESALLDGCTNAYVGTWILQQNMVRYGQTWEAVGAYNAASPARRQRYASAVYGKLRQLLSSPLPGTPPGGQRNAPLTPVAQHGPRMAAGFRQPAQARPAAAFSSSVSSSVAGESLAAYEATGGAGGE